MLAVVFLCGLAIAVLHFIPEKKPAPEEKFPEKITKHQEQLIIQPPPSHAQEPQAKSDPVKNERSTPDHLSESLQAAKLALAVKDKIAALSARQLHHTPQLLIQAASRLGQVIELEAKYPERKQEFREFYGDCSYDEAIPTVTRAQCLKLYISQISGTEKDQQRILDELPPAVVHLYQNL